MPRPTEFRLISSTILAAAALSLFSVGCASKDSQENEPPYGETATGAVAASPAPDGGGATANPAAPGGADAPVSAGGPGGPMMGMGDASAPLTPTPELDKKIDALEKGGDKKALAAAYADRGYARMTDDAAGARVKYRAALEDFRRSLELDPANAKSLENKKMIEDIYRSMGRPVPGEDPLDAKSGSGGGGGDKSIGFPMGEAKKPE